MHSTFFKLINSLTERVDKGELDFKSYREQLRNTDQSEKKEIKKKIADTKITLSLLESKKSQSKVLDIKPPEVYEPAKKITKANK